MRVVCGLKLKAPRVSCAGISDALSPVRKTSHSGFTRGRSCVRQPAVRIGDADHRLRESLESCRPTELAADPVNLYLRTDEDGFCGNSGNRTIAHGVILLRPKQSRDLNIPSVS